MNIYNKSSLIDFYKKYNDAKLPLQIWYEDANSATWKSPNELKQLYGGSVSILKNSRAVFNIKGNDYRMVVSINYETSWVFVKYIGTHAAYDRIDANQIDLYKGKKK